MHESSEPRSRSRFDLATEITRLTWSQFEQLCEAILRRKHANDEVLGLNREGGDSSEGVDFVALGSDPVAYQVKRKRDINGSLLRRCVEDFDPGTWREQCNRFVIISAFRATPSTIKTYLELKAECAARGLSFELVDFGWIDERLCTYPEIAGRFFGDSAQLWYEDRVMLARSETEAAVGGSSIRHFRIQHDDVRCEDVGFRLDAMLPTLQNPFTCAQVRFYQPGAYDVHLELDNDQLLDAFEESQWTDGVPFRSIKVKDNFLVRIASGRTLVPAATAHGLADAMRFMRDAWHTRMQTLSGAREAKGYQYIDDLHGYRLGSIRREFWSAVVDFANAHRHDDGTTPWHMFLDNHQILQVFTSSHRRNMRPGYHMTLRTVNLWKRSGAYIDLIWTLPPSFLDDGGRLSREGWWPVHMTARWLEEQLLPEVWAWHHRDQRNSWGRFVRPKHESPSFEVRNWWRSARAPLYAEQKPTTRDAMNNLFSDLQEHYAMRDGRFPPEFLRSIDVALLRLLENAELQHWDYLRSKAELGGDRDAMIAHLRDRIAQTQGEAPALGIEWRLRTFKEICTNSGGHINGSDLEETIRAISPLTLDADRYHERLAYRAEPSRFFPL